MSDFGEIMDALVTAAGGAVSGLTASRVVKYADEIGAENFPYLCVYDPGETSELGDYLLTQDKGSVEMMLFTNGETQEAIALKMDAIRDAIKADRTLGGVVQLAHVASRRIYEDPSTDVKYGHFIVETTEATGRIFHAIIEAQVIFGPSYTTWTTNIGAIHTFLQTHFGDTDMTEQWRVDRETVPSGATRYQLRAILSEIVEISSNDTGMRAELEIHYYRHIGAAEDERTIIEGTCLNELDGVLSSANWRALASVYELAEPPRITLANVGREA